MLFNPLRAFIAAKKATRTDERIAPTTRVKIIAKGKIFLLSLEFCHIQRLFARQTPDDAKIRPQ